MEAILSLSKRTHCLAKREETICGLSAAKPNVTTRSPGNRDQLLIQDFDIRDSSPSVVLGFALLSPTYTSCLVSLLVGNVPVSLVASVVQ